MRDQFGHSYPPRPHTHTLTPTLALTPQNALHLSPNVNNNNFHVAIYADQGYTADYNRNIVTKRAVPNVAVRGAEVELENRFHARSRVFIENHFGDTKNVFKILAEKHGKLVVRGDLNSRRNTPVLFGRQEIAVASFFQNLRSLTRQNRVSTQFNFVRAGQNAPGKKILPTLEAYVNSFI